MKRKYLRASHRTASVVQNGDDFFATFPQRRDRDLVFRDLGGEKCKKCTYAGLPALQVGEDLAHELAAESVAGIITVLDNVSPPGPRGR